MPPKNLPLSPGMEVRRRERDQRAKNQRRVEERQGLQLLGVIWDFVRFISLFYNSDMSPPVRCDDPSSPFPQCGVDSSGQQRQLTPRGVMCF